MAKTPTYYTGAAGEYAVAAELSARRWLATITVRNAPGTDILARREDEQRFLSIQTKTSTPGSPNIILSRKDERPAVGDEWFVMVSLQGEGVRPRVFVLPRDVVGECLFASHRDWLSKAGRGGKVRADSGMRDIPIVELANYEEQWALLDRPASEAPFLGPPVWVERALRNLEGLTPSPDFPDVRPTGYPGLRLAGRSASAEHHATHRASGS